MILSFLWISQAAAQTALVVHQDNAARLNAVLTAEGYTISEYRASTFPSGELTNIATYDIVWDLRYASPITSSEANAFLGYVEGGGKLFLMGEFASFATRNNSLLSALNTTFGAGGVSLSGVTTDGPFSALGNFQTPNSNLSFSLAASNTFSNVGSGVLLTERDSNPGTGPFAAWNASKLSSVTDTSDGMIISGLDTNFVDYCCGTRQTGDTELIENLLSTFELGGTALQEETPNVPQIEWVDWTMPGSYPKTGDRDTYATGTTGTVTNPANSATVNVTLTGEVMSKSADTFSSWNNNESSNGEGYNVDSNLYSPAGEDLIAQTGFTDAADRAHTITFDQNVTGVVMGIWSLGGSQPSTLVFSDDFEVFDTESTGGMVRVDTALGYELRGGTGGADGSAGLIQFCGTFGPSNPLTYTVTDPEYDSGMNVAITTRTYTGGTCGATKEVDVSAPIITGPSGSAGAGTSAITVNENQATVTQMTADETVTWTISGDDADAFVVHASGAITFKAAPDYENPIDQGDTAGNNTYVLIVKATDAIGNFSTQTVVDFR